MQGVLAVNETLMAATGASPELVQQLEVQQQFVQRSTGNSSSSSSKYTTAGAAAAASMPNNTRYSAPSESPQRSSQRSPQRPQLQQQQQQQQQRAATADHEYRREQHASAEQRHAVDDAVGSTAEGWWTATSHLGTATRYCLIIHSVYTRQEYCYSCYQLPKLCCQAVADSVECMRLQQLHLLGCRCG
jgi:hypothetical protein